MSLLTGKMELYVFMDWFNRNRLMFSPKPANSFILWQSAVVEMEVPNHTFGIFKPPITFWPLRKDLEGVLWALLHFLQNGP